MLIFVLAAVLRCGDLCSADSVSQYAHLLEQGGYGRLSFERAGFLIRESGGTITMAPWEVSAFERASTREAVPSGTIAIVHTHPRSSNGHPSAGDRETARRTGLPVVVITPEGVVAGMPDGRIVWLVRGASWWKNSAR